MTYEGPPPRWKKYLHEASRSQRFLWKMALGLIAAAVCVGFAFIPDPDRPRRDAVADADAAAGERPAPPSLRAGSKTEQKVRELWNARDFAALARLQDEPAYAGMFTPQLELQVAVGLRDWSRILPLMLRLHFTSYQTGILILAIVGGIAWGFFLAHLGEWPRMFSTTALLCLAAIACGVASTVPAVCASIWQDGILGFGPGDEAPKVLAYFVGGVAMREELCKLLFVLPLMPFLLRRDDELEALVVASFVGLGYAMQESASVFMKSDATSAGRLLSANFFHLALTGVNGLALFRAFRWGARGWNEFLFVLPVTIVAHGLFDGIAMLPAVDDTGYVSMVIYVLFCFYYFRRAHELRGNARMTISLTGAFVFGLSLLSAAAVVHYMTHMGAGEGAMAFATEAIASGIVVILFFRVFNEPLYP